MKSAARHTKAFELLKSVEAFGKSGNRQAFLLNNKLKNSLFENPKYERQIKFIQILSSLSRTFFNTPARDNFVIYRQHTHK